MKMQSTWNFAWKLQLVMFDFHGQPTGRWNSSLHWRTEWIGVCPQNCSSPINMDIYFYRTYCAPIYTFIIFIIDGWHQGNSRFCCKPRDENLVQRWSHSAWNFQEYSCTVLSILVVTTVLIDTYGTRVSLMLFSGSSRPSFCRLSGALGIRYSRTSL